MAYPGPANDMGVGRGPTPSPGPAPPPYDLTTTLTMLTLGRVFALLAAIVEIIAAINTFLDSPVSSVGWFVAFGVSLAIFAMVGRTRELADLGKIREAKGQLLLWMVLAFIFALFLGGVFLLVAYLKFDEVLAAPSTLPYGPPGALGTRAVSPGVPYYVPAGATAYNPYAPPTAPAPLPASYPSVPGAVPAVGPVPPAPSAPCPRCGRPATWIPQYGRWYCYAEQLYL